MSEILTFFALALGITYAIGLPIAAASQGYLPVKLPPALIFLSLFGPSLAALILTGRKQGWHGVKQLLTGLFRWRVAAIWYFIAILLPLAISLTSLVIYGLFTGNWIEFPPQLPGEVDQLGPIAYMILPIFWILQSLGEEIGWRGYALPRLLAKQSPISGSLTLGTVWAIWHLPLFLTRDSVQSQISFGWYLLYTMCMAILFTWLYIRTGGNLLIATVFHAANQPATVFLPILPPMADTTLPFILSVTVTLFVALVIVISNNWIRIHFRMPERIRARKNRHNNA